MAIGMMLAAMAWVYFFVPESPTFLLEIQDYEKLEQCLIQIAKINGIEDFQKIKDLILKIKLSKQTEMSFNTDLDAGSKVAAPEVVWTSADKKNLIACCYLQSMAGFVTYLIIYYSKYFEGNFYVNYTLQGFADCLSIIYVIFFQRRYTKVTQTLYFLIFILIGLTICSISMSHFLPLKWQSTTLPIIMLLIKLQTCSM